MRNPRLVRWIVPAAALALVIGAGGLSMSASAKDSLPPRTAEQLLVDVQNAKPQPLSGVVETSSNLGLPAMPGMGGPHGGGESPLGVLAGTNTFRVWVGAHDQQKVAWVTARAETSVVHNGSDVWVWDSGKKTADHIVLPAVPDRPVTPHATPSGMPSTPAEAAQQVLALLDKTTTVSVDKQVSVAGRAAYELVLTPKSTVTRVKGVRIAVDGETKLPLRVQVVSTVTNAPAISVGFTSVTFGTPDPAVFTFTPGPGVSVTTTTIPTASPEEIRKAIDEAKAKREGTDKPAILKAKPTVTGTGWDTVVAGKADLNGSDSKDSDLGSILDMLPTRTGAWGTARVLDGTLVSAVVTDDGRFAVGAVSPETLLAALPAS